MMKYIRLFCFFSLLSLSTFSTDLLAQCPILSSALATCVSGPCGTTNTNCTFEIEICWSLQSANNVSFEYQIFNPNDMPPTPLTSLIQIGSLTADGCMTETISNYNCNGAFDVSWAGYTSKNHNGNQCAGQNGFEIPLPVLYGDLSIKKRSENDIYINWTTLSEENNEKFIIERSTSDENFIPIGEVKGKGTFDGSAYYQFVDIDPPSDYLYYRIIQVDYNGYFDISKLLSFDNRQKEESFEIIYRGVYKSLSIMNGDLNSKFFISDLSGRIYKQGNVSGKNLQLNLSNLSSGMYILSLTSKNEVTSRKFFIH